ncbi:MAG TPA: hypothetical protein VF218_05680 [Acidothermaceae bacterium]
MSTSNTMRVLATPLGPLTAGLLLTSASPRATIVALAAPTVAIAVLGSLSNAIRNVPPLRELADATSSATAG